MSQSDVESIPRPALSRSHLFDHQYTGDNAADCLPGPGRLSRVRSLNRCRFAITSSVVALVTVRIRPLRLGRCACVQRAATEEYALRPGR